MKPQPLAIFTADNHLRPVTWQDYPSLHGDAYVAFNEIVDMCCQFNCPLFLLGDTFDSTHPPSDAVRTYYDAIDRLGVAGLNAYYIKGNHDDAEPAWQAIHSAAVCIDQDVVDIQGMKIAGLDFRQSSQLKDALHAMDLQWVDVLVTHQSWREMLGVGHPDGEFATDFPTKRNHNLIVITGDLHKHGEYVVHTSDGVPLRVFSPGSTAMQKINEEPVKYVYGLFQDPWRLDRIQLQTRPYYQFECHSPADLDRVVEELQQIRPDYSLPPLITKPMARVKFAADLPEAGTRLKAACGDNLFLFLSPVATGCHDVTVALPTDDNYFSLQDAVDITTAQLPGEIRDISAAFAAAENLQAVYDAALALFTQNRMRASGCPTP